MTLATNGNISNRAVRYHAAVYKSQHLEKALNSRSTIFCITDKLGITHHKDTITELWNSVWGELSTSDRTLNKAIGFCTDFRKTLPDAQKAVFDKALNLSVQKPTTTQYFGASSNLLISIRDSVGNEETIASPEIAGLHDEEGLKKHPLLLGTPDGKYSLNSKALDCIDKIDNLNVNHSPNTESLELAKAYYELAKALPEKSDSYIGALVIARKYFREVLSLKDCSSDHRSEGEDYLTQINEKLVSSFYARRDYDIDKPDGAIDFMKIPIPTIKKHFYDKDENLSSSHPLTIQAIKMHFFVNDEIFWDSELLDLLSSDEVLAEKYLTDIFQRNAWDPGVLEVLNLKPAPVKPLTRVHNQATVMNEQDQEKVEKARVAMKQLLVRHPEIKSSSKQQLALKDVEEDKRDFIFAVRDNESAYSSSATDHLNPGAKGVFKALVKSYMLQLRALQNDKREHPDLYLKSNGEASPHKVAFNLFVRDINLFRDTMLEYHKARENFLGILGLPLNTAVISVGGLDVYTPEVTNALIKWGSENGVDFDSSGTLAPASAVYNVHVTAPVASGSNSTPIRPSMRIG